MYLETTVKFVHIQDRREMCWAGWVITYYSILPDRVGLFIRIWWSYTVSEWLRQSVFLPNTHSASTYRERQRICYHLMRTCTCMHIAHECVRLGFILNLVTCDTTTLKFWAQNECRAKNEVDWMSRLYIFDISIIDHFLAGSCWLAAKTSQAARSCSLRKGFWRLPKDSCVPTALYQIALSLSIRSLLCFARNHSKFKGLADFATDVHKQIWFGLIYFKY